MWLNDQDEIVLGDFGVSLIFKEDENADRVRMIQGTPHYMAPEMFKTGDPNKMMMGKQLDIWALGLSLFKIVNLDLPFDTKTNGMKLRESIKVLIPDYSGIEKREDENVPLLV